MFYKNSVLVYQAERAIFTFAIDSNLSNKKMGATILVITTQATYAKNYRTLI